MDQLMQNPYTMPALAFAAVAGGLTYYPMTWQRDGTGKMKVWAQPMVLGAAAAVAVYMMNEGGFPMDPLGGTTGRAVSLPIDKY